jgi:ABC-type oligopeptide transport system substrate-binding subunit
MYHKNFHIYTGGWSLSRDPDYLYDLFNSAYYNPDINEFAQNYCGIQDALFDLYTRNLKTPATLEEAELNAKLAQQRWVNQAFMVPLWTTLGYMAHNKALHVLNVDSFGVRNWWNLYSANYPAVGITGGTLEWGFKSDVEQLNVIFSQWVWDWQILDKVFDSLIAMNPLNIAVDMPWMASGWTIGTWTNPDTGEVASKISFNLKTGIKWVNSLTGAIIGDVTPADVKFSYQYVSDQIGWNFPSVADLYQYPNGTRRIEISGNTLTFYEAIQSVWAFHWAGGLPIIPKSVYEGIANAHGFTPGGLGIPATMIGSGAYYFSSYTSGVSALMTSNRNYFMPIVPNTDSDPLNVKIDWGIFKGNVRSGDWTVNVLDLIIVAGQLGWTGPPGDIPADVKKDGVVNVLDLIIVATNLGASW